MSKENAMTDWERDTGCRWPNTPPRQVVYSQHHYDNGMLIVPRHGPFRFRDKVARLFGYHCWPCARL